MKIRGDKLRIIVIQIILILISCSILFPFYYMCVNTFKTKMAFSKDEFGIPDNFTMENIFYAWQKGDLGYAFINTSIVGVGVIIVTLLLGSLAGYAISKMDFTLRKIIYLSLLATMFFSIMQIVIPLYVQMSAINLLNTYTSGILIYSGLQMVFTIYVLTSFFNGIPNELLEAAVIDGCSDLGIYYKIILPLSKPALITVGVMNLVFVWNDLVIALLFLTKKTTLMLAITSFQTRFSVNMPAIIASTFLATIPIVVLYLFLQKYFVRGMTAGAIK